MADLALRTYNLLQNVVSNLTAYSGSVRRQNEIARNCSTNKFSRNISINSFGLSCTC